VVDLINGIIKRKIIDMDKQRFSETCDKVRNTKSKSNGIGTLGEKTLHAILKNYFEPMEDNHEKKVGSFVADISRESGIIEIQTRQFNKLRKKLEYFLALTDVTVVYPVAHTKWLIWIDEQTGETTKKRKSPKNGKPYEIFYELYKIKDLLCNTRLSFCIVMLDLEEYRSLNGWSENKKKGSTRYNRIPTDLVDEIYINSPSDYDKLIPKELGQHFTSKEFMKFTGLTLSASQTALNVLNSVGAVVRTGKQGNRYIYERKLFSEQS
jgi:hypothetical protein